MVLRMATLAVVGAVAASTTTAIRPLPGGHIDAGRYPPPRPGFHPSYRDNHDDIRYNYPPPPSPHAPSPRDGGPSFFERIFGPPPRAPAARALPLPGVIELGEVTNENMESLAYDLVAVHQACESFVYTYCDDSEDPCRCIHDNMQLGTIDGQCVDAVHFLRGLNSHHEHHGDGHHRHHRFLKKFVDITSPRIFELLGIKQVDSREYPSAPRLNEHHGELPGDGLFGYMNDHPHQSPQRGYSGSASNLEDVCWYSETVNVEAAQEWLKSIIQDDEGIFGSLPSEAWVLENQKREWLRQQGKLWLKENMENLLEQYETENSQSVMSTEEEEEEEAAWIRDSFKDAMIQFKEAWGGKMKHMNAEDIDLNKQNGKDNEESRNWWAKSANQKGMPEAVNRGWGATDKWGAEINQKDNSKEGWTNQISNSLEEKDAQDEDDQEMISMLREGGVRKLGHHIVKSHSRPRIKRSLRAGHRHKRT